MGKGGKGEKGNDEEGGTSVPLFPFCDALFKALPRCLFDPLPLLPISPLNHFPFYPGNPVFYVWLA